jgi:hypothetical protein
MMMKVFLKTKIFLFFLLFFFHHHLSYSQTISAKIIDAQNGEVIPFANILIDNNNALVSNDEGIFSFSAANSNTTISVSYIGYSDVQLSVSQLQEQKNIIKITPVLYELNELNVDNKKLTPAQIMANVKANINSNYTGNGISKKNMIFMRHTDYMKPKNIEVDITKSTGFSKDALKKANTELSNFTNFIIKNNPREYKDVLMNYYAGKTTNKENKVVDGLKVDVIKATILKNENSAVNQDEIQKSFVNIMLQHLDTTKYYRIKSGLFGSKDTVSLRSDFNKNKSKKKANNTNTDKVKTNLLTFLSNNSVTNNSKFNFIYNPEWYDYKLEGIKYTANYDFVYVLSFKPRKSKAIYEGKLYVSDTDFAILRADYAIAKGKKGEGINLKLLLGVKTFETVDSGTIIYKKNPSDKGYYIQYASIEKGQYIYLNRPLKFIELTNEDRDVVAFDLKFESDNIDKTEYLNISRTESDDISLDKITETDFKYITLKAYDASLWKNYSTIEPLEEMKQFKAVD